MAFPNGDEKPKSAQTKICITVLTAPRSGGDRAQTGLGGLPDLLAIGTDEPDGLLSGQVGTATVLMDVRRDRYPRRQDVLRAR
jgi:hypothetical protein